MFCFKFSIIDKLTSIFSWLNFPISIGSIANEKLERKIHVITKKISLSFLIIDFIFMI